MNNLHTREQCDVLNSDLHSCRKRKASIGDEIASGWRSKKVLMGR